MAQQMKKPKFKIYSHGELESEKKEDQEQKFDDWNMYMKIRLESFYRISWLVACSINMINIMIQIFFGHYYFNWYYYIFTWFQCV